MISQEIVDAVLLDFQQRQQLGARHDTLLEDRMEGFMIDPEVVEQLTNQIMSLHMQYMSGMAVVNIPAAVAEAFVTGVVCGRMEILQQGG